MGKKILLCVFMAVFCLSVSGYSQTTTQSYSFSAFSSTYSSISATGTAMPALIGVATTQMNIALGFPFYFCGGTPIFEVSASAKGWVSLTNSRAWDWPSKDNAAFAISAISGIGSSGGIGGLLFPFWEDIGAYTGGSAYYKTTGSAPNRVFTMEWKNWKHLGSSDSGDFQVKLYEGTSVIDFCYGPGTLASSAASIGIGNSETDYRTLPDPGTSPIPSSSPSGTFTSTIATKPADGQVYRWTPCPVSISAINSGAACPGGTVTLLGTTSATSYAWTGPGGFSSSVLTTTLTSFTPTMSGTYSLTATNGTCTVMATTFVTHLPISPVPVLTSTSTTICNDSSVVISTSVGSLPTTLLSQDFNTSLGEWTITSLVGLPVSYWQLRTPPGYVASPAYAIPGDGSQYLEAVSIATWTSPSGYAHATTNTLVTSPSFSTFGYSGATLTFNQYYWSGYWYWNATAWGDIMAAVEYSTDGGGTWDTVLNITPSTFMSTVGAINWSDATPTATVALPPAAIGMPNVKLRWHYYSYWGYLWAIDNIKVTGTSYTVLPAAWTPTSDLFTDPAFTVPYTAGTPASAIYVHPTTVTASTITYTATMTASGYCSSSVPITITVNPDVPDITGAMMVCTGYATALSNSLSGGIWSTATPGVATIGPSGIVTGLVPGTAVIYYTVAGCSAIGIVTVATPSAITGVKIACLGSNTTLGNSMPGGTWSSGNASVASVGAATGIVSGISLGTAVITYSMGGGCEVTTIVTVNPFPDPISGPPEICIGGIATLSSTTPGGIWLSGTTGVASVGLASGIVSGIALGTAVISYRVNSCAAIQIMTVAAATAPITGPTIVCTGYPSITLTDATLGGSWMSSDPAIAIAGSSTGIVTGVAAGTSTITYLVSAGCPATQIVTVLPVPAAITGTTAVCQGTTTTLSHPDPGGVWSSSNSAIASVDPGSGVVLGVVTGSNVQATATITYTLPGGCVSITAVTVNPLPASIGGALSICRGATTLLSSASLGGVWSSSSPSVGTVDGTSGLVSGMLAGTTTISYSIGTGCTVAAVVTVNPLPDLISGASSVCQGNSTFFISGTGGGSWISSDPLIAAVTSGGMVSGVAPGIATISYVLSTGCLAAKSITVIVNPPAITGNMGICAGSTTTLSNGMPGGIWSSVTPSVVTISSLGIANGLSVGTSVISYIVMGCASTGIVSVNPLPAPITGSLAICVNSTTALTDATSGGSWSSSTTTYGTIDMITGIVTGVSGPGTATITYTSGSSGCFTTANLTVNPLPSIPGGSVNLCSGAASTLSGMPGGGLWSSSSSAIASINVSSGTITGGTVAIPSIVAITYTTIPSGCSNNITVTVNPLPAPITGTDTVCVGNTTTLSSVAPGAAWASDNTVVATVFSTTGVVTGNAAGTATITCTGVGGCYRTTVVNVDPLPALISGPPEVCEGSLINQTSMPIGGTWTSSNPGVATIAPASGTVTGMTGPGTATIIYTLGTGCRTSRIITINPLPGAITGISGICIGSTTVLDCAPSGGTWVSSNPGIVAVGSSSGFVTTVSGAGTSIVTYTLGTGCTSQATITVSPSPAITGTLSFGEGSNSVFSCAPGGGTWSSGNLTVGTIDPVTGIMYGISGGTTALTYISPIGCATSRIATVNPLPGAITGGPHLCVGANITLSCTPIGGSWSSSNATVADIGGVTGIIAGYTAGTSIITYTLPTGTMRTYAITVNALPGPITGATNVCVGSSTTLADPDPGGAWTIAGSATGMIGAVTGIFTGLSPGAVMISYTLSTGCSVARLMVVNPLPDAITGTLKVCESAAATLTCTPSGGIWSATGTNITVGVITGMITGNMAGTSIVTYTTTAGCRRMATVTVEGLPALINGSLGVCTGLTSALTDVTGGGIWASGNPLITLITSGGVISGLSAGTAIISYTHPVTGCSRTAEVTVSPLPANITGGSVLCNLTSVTMSSLSPGGMWSSLNPGVVTINAATGVAIGVNAGATTITYQLSAGCYTTFPVTVNPSPGIIVGQLNVCAGSTTHLGNALTGGIWTSGAAGIADINPSTGIATGISAGGTAKVTYTLSNDCMATAVLSVNPTPLPINGMTGICVGATAVMSDATPGGSWESDNPGVAGIGSSGLVTGVSPGTAAITYKTVQGCYSVQSVNVNPLPAAIIGPPEVCEGSTIILTETSGPGIWLSSDTLIAAIDSNSGVLTGISGVPAGIVAISYTLSTGCSVDKVVTVNVTPPAITGSGYICQESTVVLGNIMAGGVWHSSNAAAAIIGLSTGIVIPVTPGTSFISYTLPTGCQATKLVTVSPLPVVYSVTGGGSYCGGNGVLVGLSGSQAGVNYVLYNGPSVTGYHTGTGSPFDFGLMTLTGTYTVRATDATSGCTESMTGSTSVTITPLNVPEVSISAGANDTLCKGTIVHLTPIPVYGGLAPSYVWEINGVSVSTANSYSYIPADGDVATVIMHSNDDCISDTVVTGSRKLVVVPGYSPDAIISVAPGNTICQHSPVTFIAHPVYGGINPVYSWMVNGVSSGGASNPTFTYVPGNGDQVHVRMTSNYRCRLADEVTSSKVVMTVDSLIVPEVIIVADSVSLIAGQQVTLHAIATRAGLHPSYQWIVKGIPVPGATSDRYTSMYQDHDSVICMVTSDGICRNTGAGSWIFITVALPEDVGEIAIIPNPNNGTFIIKGSTGTTFDETFDLAITDMLGQVIYRGSMAAVKGKVNHQVILSNALANGMYLLTARSDHYRNTFHFVIRK